MRLFRFSQRAGALVFLASVTVVAACSGDLGSGYTPAPTHDTANITTSTTAAVTLPTLSTSGFHVSGSLPIANAAVTVKEAISVAAPSGVTALIKHREDTTTPDAILYVSFSSASSVTLSAIPAFTFTSSSISSSNTYYLALDTSSGWQNPISGPGVVSGDTVSFASATGSVSITSTQPAVFALVEETLLTPLASPNQLVFDESSPAPQSFSVSETNYAGAFTEQTSCTASPVPSPAPSSSPYVAQVTPSSATPASAGASVSFTVTPGAETGSCTITVTDSNSGTTTVPVSVALDQVIIYDRKRH